MEFAKLQALEDEALVHRELQYERDLIQATFQHKTSQLEDTSVLSKLRKDIARSRTVQRSRERAQGLRNNALRERYRSSFKPGQVQAEVETQSPDTKGFLEGIASKLGIGGKDAD